MYKSVQSRKYLERRDNNNAILYKSCHLEMAGLQLNKRPIWTCSELISQSQTKIFCIK